MTRLSKNPRPKKKRPVAKGATALQLQLTRTKAALKRCQKRLTALLDSNGGMSDQFPDLFEEAPIAYVHEALDSRFIRANRAALNLLGIRPEEVSATYGKSLVAATHDTQTRLREAFDSLTQGKERGAVELELRRKDNGRPVWVQWWSTPAPARDYTRTMMIDISDRVLIEQTKMALEFSLESGLVGDWDLDLIHDTSRRSLRHDQCFGYTEPVPEAQWGFQTFSNHLHPEDRERVQTTFSQAVEAGTYWSSEFRVIWKDQSVHWLAARGKVFRREGRKATRMLGIVMEITERKRAEEDLLRAEEAVRATKMALEFSLEAGQIGDWDLDLIRDTSRRSLRHDRCFGYREPIPEGEWSFGSFMHHVHPDDRNNVESSFRAAVAAVKLWDCEFRVVWPDQSVHWLAGRGQVFQLEAGKATRVLGVVMDITERKRAEQSLRASEELARGQFEALRSTLDTLALEVTPEILVGHILRTITRQLDAHSSSVWCKNESNGLIELAFAFEDHRLVTAADPRFKGMDLTLPMLSEWPWPGEFLTGKPSVIEDIRAVPAFPLRDRLLPLGIVSVLLIPMIVGGSLGGAIGLRFASKREFRKVEVELGQALANLAMLMIEVGRLSAQSREAAVIAERNRIAREVHDTLAQGIFGVIVQLDAAADATTKGLPLEAQGHLSRAGALARDSLEEARRSVQALRPQALQDVDLATAMEELAGKMTEGTSLSVQFTRTGSVRQLPEDWDGNILRIGQEVITNALRHAQASELSIKLSFGSREVSLRLQDNGRGFNPDAPRDGFGLIGMRERVDGMGGSLTLRSYAGKGTSILIVLPLPADTPGRDT